MEPKEANGTPGMRTMARDSFEDHYGLVKRVVEYQSRRRHFSREDTEDCESWVVLRLWQNWETVERRFSGRSSFSSYLTVVVTNLCGDYANHTLGRWRPSAEAQRQGPDSIKLETMVHRDGWGSEEAIRYLTDNDLVEASPEELDAMLEALPPRERRRFVTLPHDDRSPSAATADEEALQHEADRIADEVVLALRRELEKLEPIELLVILLHFRDGLPLSQVAKRLKLPQRPLYRKVPRQLKQLRKRLEAQGISWDKVEDAFRGTRGLGREGLPPDPPEPDDKSPERPKTT